MNTLVKIFWSILCVVILQTSYAQERKLRVVVFDFDTGMCINNDGQFQGAANIFKAELVKTGMFTVVDYNLPNKIREECGDVSKLVKHDEFKQFCQTADIDAVIYGIINLSIDQCNQKKYDIDVQLINTKDGSIMSAIGYTSYKTIVDRSLYVDIVRQLVDGYRSSNSNGENKPYVLYDYLYVYPEDLGEFQTQPNAVISAINKQSKYGFSDWRLPNREERDLLSANLYAINAYSAYPYAFKDCWSDNNTYAIRLVRTQVLVQSENNTMGSVFAPYESHDFGIIPVLGGIVSYKFTIQNQTDSTVNITAVNKANASISVNWNKNSFGAGESTTITVNYNPNGRQGARFNSDITVSISNGQTIKLNVKGHVN